MKQFAFISLIMIAVIAISACKSGQFADREEKAIDTLVSNVGGQGLELVIEFQKGKEHNHPTFVFWVEDMNENYIQTLFVTKSLATGIFGHAALTDSSWQDKPGIARRPATLPYWLHKRNVLAPDGTYLPTPENPILDTYTGATPHNNFHLKTKSDKQNDGKFRLMFEINQPWDWNNYWHNSLYPNDKDYKTSCQPSLIFSVIIDPKNDTEEYYLNPIGHGHYSGKDGKLYTDLTTMTTALDIVKSLKVTIKK